MEYIQRLDHFAATRTWTLDKIGVNWADDNGESGRIAYSAISRVRLRFEPSRAERRRFAMRFQASQEYLITNINYRGMLDFIDQSSRFHSFVMVFHDNLDHANPDVDYRSGSTITAYIGNWALTLFIFLMLGFAALFFISIGMVWIAVVKAIIIIFHLPALFTAYPDGRVPAEKLGRLPEKLREKAQYIIRQNLTQADNIQEVSPEVITPERKFGGDSFQQDKMLQSYDFNETNRIENKSQSRRVIDINQIKNKKKLKRLFTAYPDGNIPTDELNKLPDRLRQKVNEIGLGGSLKPLQGEDPQILPGIN